ncbi:MAG: alpha-amylase/4-alpha-glucanotransferase domain-containing protein, partial [Deltaproteobacteria bacterium]
MPNFIFCVHNHQPVGNFGHVIEDSYRNAYLPFLKAIKKYPSIKLSFHITGYLLDWLLENHIEYIELLREMVNKGQVEMMGGGYYEPILAVIPPQDRIGQIRMMSDKLKDVFGKRPRGVWLAERIWEPQLPLYLKEAGMEYIVVDDYHFMKAGLRKEQLTGYYITEDLGKTLKVFPGSERLRYIIPFETVDKFLENIRWVETLGPNPAAIFADDGEKFGTWPGTHQWVYKEEWLKKFLEAVVENKELVKPVTFSEYIDDNEPLGRVYLPTTSYIEMGEWALPAEAAETYTNLINEVKTWQDGERIKRFLQGGFWRNFFAKYPEANWLHKRMLMVSEEVRSSGDSRIATTSHLYMAQCNDAYWHGVFGGLYLPHLRRAVYENLIKAENLIEEIADCGLRIAELKSKIQNPKSEIIIQEADFDADTFNEILIRTPQLNLFFSPHNGGSLIEMDYRPKCVNLSNTLSRWEEGYHHRVKRQSSETNKGEAKSIHDLTVSKEEDLEKYLFFDKYRRVSLVDHFLKKEETLDAFRMSTYEELGDFIDRPYERKSGVRSQPLNASIRGQKLEDVRFILSREGHRIRVEKDLFVKGNEIDIKYLVTNLEQ